MKNASRLFSGLNEHLHPKVIINDSKTRIDIEGAKPSGCAQSEDKSQLGHMKVFERSDTMLRDSTDEPHRLQQGYDELSHAYRLQQMTKREVAVNRKRKIEVEETPQKRSNESYNFRERHGRPPREWKAQADDSEEIKFARKAAQDLRESLHETKDRFHTQQKEMRALKVTLNRQMTSLNEALGSKTAAQQEAERLRSELNVTREQLQVCKDDLFRLQPMSQLPDTEIVKEFETICQDIVSWIDVEISAFEKSHPDAESSQIFSSGPFTEATNLLERFPTFGEYLVRYEVQYCLHKTIFSGSVYLLGLPEEIKQYLQAAEERMANLEPPRDFETINTWRSETLTALAPDPKLAINRETEINHILDRIFVTVAQFFPIIHLQAQSKQRLLNEVVLPAASLASKIQLAASIYDFWLPANPFWEFEPITVDNYGGVKMIDIKTRKTLKESSIVVQDGERRIGKAVMSLEPSLWRINEKGDDTLLRQTTILIELDQPLPKRNNASS